MKPVTNKFTTFAVIFTGILCFIACSEKEPVLEVTPRYLIFHADDTDEKSVSVETDASVWSYHLKSINWLDVYTKPGEAGKLFFKTNKNTDSNSSRTASVTITAGKTSTVEIAVEQLKKETNDLSVTPDRLDFNMFETGEKYISIKTDAPFWEAFKNVPWLELRWLDQTLIVTSTETNRSGFARSAEVIITAGNALPLIVPVTQGATGTLEVSPSSLSFTASETGAQHVAVTTNMSGWVANTAASWLVLTQNNNLLSVSAFPNSASTVRYATITVMAGGQERTILVSQAAGVMMTIATRTYYRASGIQLNENLEFNANWSGEIIPNNSASVPNITITNWSGAWGPSIWCNYTGGKYRLDVTSKIGDDTDGIHAAYMCIGTYNRTTKEIRLYPGVEYDLNYNATTKILDFSGTYNGLPTCIAMVAKNKLTGLWNASRTYFNIYTNLKLEFTTATYTASETENSKNTNVSSGFEGTDITKDANVKIVISQ